MALTGKSLIALLSIAMASGADKEKPKFTALPVDSYPLRQTIDKVTVAAAPFRSNAETEAAFGKLNPNHYGVLPILIVIRNDSDKTLALDKLKLEFVSVDRQHIDATPAADLKYLKGANTPNVYGGPIPGMPPRVSRKKSPLSAWEIEGRAFTARMLPPNETASGFFYFRTFYSSGSTLLLSGLRDAASGKEWFYFEIPLDKQAAEYPDRRLPHTARLGRYPFP